MPRRAAARPVSGNRRLLRIALLTPGATKCNDSSGKGGIDKHIHSKKPKKTAALTARGFLVLITWIGVFGLTTAEGRGNESIDDFLFRLRQQQNLRYEMLHCGPKLQQYEAPSAEKFSPQDACIVVTPRAVVPSDASSSEVSAAEELPSEQVSFETMSLPSVEASPEQKAP